MNYQRFLKSVERTDHPKWRYRLKAPYTFDVGRNPRISSNECWECYGQSSKGPRLLGTATSKRITIFAGYSWDGATGAPTFDRVLRGTIEHDFGCQMQASPGFRVYVADQPTVDWWLLWTASQDKFVFAPIYYAAVRAYWLVKGVPPEDGVTHITAGAI
jgi:hypothetical protein